MILFKENQKDLGFASRFDIEADEFTLVCNTNIPEFENEKVFQIANKTLLRDLALYCNAHPGSRLLVSTDIVIELVNCKE